jgi:hypothetical protein
MAMNFSMSFHRSPGRWTAIVCALLFAVSGGVQRQAAAQSTLAPFEVSANHRFFQNRDQTPFFWLGDTAWLLFKRLNREEAERYLEDRRAKGFNIVQVMVLHTAGDINAYGSAALLEQDPGRPNVTAGNDLAKEGEYDFWDHVDWIVDKAAEKGIHVGMVAAWGSVARGGHLNEGNVEAYTRFLAQRYGNRPNIVWLTGGDTQGDRETEVWRKMGSTFRQLDANHLVTFHPFGRTQSSTWFHAEEWLDFNMFQSGHRRYGQDDTAGAKEEDNWRYVLEDYAKVPAKPTLDGEPSYEGIPQGLHDPKEPYWNDADARRYAYWSVFAGAAGHTYGHSAVMQMHKPEFGDGAYGVRKFWHDAINDPGAGQMQYLKKLMLSRPYFERVPAQEVIAGENGERYERVIATRGERYVLAYTYTGRPIRAYMGAIAGSRVRAWWYNPRDGSAAEIGVFENGGARRFDPPGEQAAGNDWVLVLDDEAAGFAAPGVAAASPERSSQ